MFPTLTCSDPENARILFDLVNAEFSRGGQDMDRRTRLVDLMVALHNEMTSDTITNGETS